MAKGIKKNKNRETYVNTVKPEASVRSKEFFLLLLVMVVIFIAYIPALSKEFINYDDDLYILNNPFVRSFKFSNIPYMFSHFYQAQYSPIPELMYGILHSLVAFRPFLYNVMSVLLHITVTLLVFQLIRLLTGNFRIAIITSALFGIAAMQVESVAWLAAVFKTGTYSIFFLLSLIAYVKYFQTGKRKFYLFSILFFIVSCFCKEQTVALPLAVIAVDLFLKRKLLTKKVLLEKIPFIMIAVISGLLTLAAAGTSSGILKISSFSFTERLIYGSYAVCMYIFKLLIPLKLSLYYPYPDLHQKGLYYIFPVLVLLIIVAWAWAVRKKHMFIVFGLLFFIVNILFSLAVQVISVREVVMADRYVYISSIGIFLMIAAGAEYLLEKKLLNAKLIYGVFMIYFLFLGVTTYSRNMKWKDSDTIISDALEKYDVAPMYTNRGIIKGSEGDYTGAINDFKKAIEIKPGYAEAYYNLGYAYNEQRLYDSAITYFSRAIYYKNDYDAAYLNRGMIYYSKKMYADAIDDYSKAIEYNPDYAKLYNNRGVAYHANEMTGKAIGDYTRAIELDTSYADAYLNRGVSYLKKELYDSSLKDFSKAIELKQDYYEAYYNRGVAYFQDSLLDNAIADYSQALALRPDYVQAYYNRGVAYLQKKENEKACTDFKKAAELGLTLAKDVAAKVCKE